MEVQINQLLSRWLRLMKLLQSGSRIYKCLLFVIIIAALFILYAIYQGQYHVWTVSHEVVDTSYKSLGSTTVHYIIDKSNFKIGLSHFISIFSVIRFLKPMTIMFHAITWPWEESYWWRVLRQVAPHVIVRKVNDVVPSGYCNMSSGTYQHMLLKLLILKEHGGIVLAFDSVIMKPLDKVLAFDAVSISSKNTVPTSILYSKKGSRYIIEWLGALADARNEEVFHHIYKTYLLQLSNTSSRAITVGSMESPLLAGILLRPLSVTLWDNAKLGNIARQVIYDYHGAGPDFHIVPRIVHLFWTETTRRDLTFVEYMSIKSAYRIYKPEKIYFYIVPSSLKPLGFYWTDTLELDQFEIVVLMNKDTLLATIGDLKVSILERSGGIFLNLTCITVNDIEFLRGYNGVVSFDGTHYGTQFIMLKPIYKYRDILSILVQQSLTERLQSAILVTADTICLDQGVCQIQGRKTDSETFHAEYDITNIFYIEIESLKFDSYNYMSIQTAKSTFGQAARFSLNGFSDIVDPKLFIVPNIIHYIWFGQQIEFQLFHLLSIYSAYIMQTPGTIYIHYETLPVGPWFPQLLRVVPTIKMIKTVPPSSIFGQTITTYVEHKADVARLEILMKYGGIYLDTDVYVLRSLDPLRTRTYRVAQPVSRHLCNCIIFSTNTSEFLKIFYESYRGDYQDSNWAYNSVLNQYTLSVDNRPDKLTIGPSDLMLKPNWKTCPRLWDNGTYIYWKDHYFMHLYCKRQHRDVVERWESEMYKHLYNTSLLGDISQFLFERFQADYITNTADTSQTDPLNS